MFDQTLYDNALYEILAKKNDFISHLGIFKDLNEACVAIHAHIYEYEDKKFRYFVNVYKYTYSLEHKLGGCKNE